MPLPNVNITLANGQLGSVLQTNDGIAGMVLTGVSESGGITSGTPVLLTGMAGLATIGLTKPNNPFAYNQITEFYNEAGTGAQLYLMLVPTTMTVASMADVNNTSGAKKLLDYAAGSIRLLGIMSDDAAIIGASGTVTVSNGLNSNVDTAVSNMQVLANTYFAAQTPFRAIIGGTSFSGDATMLTNYSNQTPGTTNRVAVLIGDTASSKAACLGTLLGRAAFVPVQRKVSRVRDGSLNITTAFIGTSTAAQYTYTEMLNDKGYITLRVFPNKSGFFFSGDTMCTSTADDYSSLARGRVIDKAQILAYNTFVNEVDDEIPVNANGNIDAGYAKWLEQQILNQVNLTMSANNEISDVDCFIDTAQNVLATSKLNVVLKVTPVGYASDIEVQLGF